MDIDKVMALGRRLAKLKAEEAQIVDELRAALDFDTRRERPVSSKRSARKNGQEITLTDRIIDTLASGPSRGMTPSEVARAVGREDNIKSIRNMIHRLAQNGRIKKLERGQYTAKEVRT